MTTIIIKGVAIHEQFGVDLVTQRTTTSGIDAGFVQEMLHARPEKDFVANLTAVWIGSNKS
jgi:hypothetical protein